MIRLQQIEARRYLSLNDVVIPLGPLNVFIGPNASGKSNVLDALRFLSEGVGEKDFSRAAGLRGGIVHLAWKGDAAAQVKLTTTFVDGEDRFMWQVSLDRQHPGNEAFVREVVSKERTGDAPQQILEVDQGRGWWWSPETKSRVLLSIPPSGCGLSAASANLSFPGRGVADFVGGWGFFDPNPGLLRRASTQNESDRLDFAGRNLAARLYAIQQTDQRVFDRILDASRSILGVPESIEFRVSEEDRRVYFVQKEPGLEYRVHQVGASSGTLRTLALMTALFGQSSSGLVGIEEPENYIHPNALVALVAHLKEASKQVQVLVTTHSPFLLDCLNSPEAVHLVRRGDTGTEVHQEPNPQAVQKALVESGFGLGEFYESRGFGG